MRNHETWASRRRSTSPGGEMSGGANVDAVAFECSLDELREFLEADLVDVPVDLEFKENLRSRLWSMIQFRNRMRASHARKG
jgi:hypothetical protein